MPVGGEISLSNERTAQEQGMQRLREEFQNVSTRLDSLQSEKSQLQEDYKGLQTTMQELKHKGTSQSELENLRSQLNAAQDQAAEKDRLLQDELARAINIRDSKARRLDSAEKEIRPLMAKLQR